MSNEFSNARTFKYISIWDPHDKAIKTPPTQVVTCFIQRGNKILVLQRARKDAQHNLWGIPGGKLKKGELPLVGLARELQEELGFKFDPKRFHLLDTALSQTPTDGKYGLYLYHITVPEDFMEKIDLEEHHASRWVTLDEFEALHLLTAQREAFWIVESKVRKLLAHTAKPKTPTCTCNATLFTVISGSFRKHLHQILDLRQKLEKHSVAVLSPHGSSAVNPDEEFIVLDSDPVSSPKLLQDSVFTKIRRSTFLVVANVQGYLGRAAVLEMGYAIALGISIYTLEPVDDPNLAPYCRSLSEIFPDIQSSQPNIENWNRPTVDLSAEARQLASSSRIAKTRK